MRLSTLLLTAALAVGAVVPCQARRKAKAPALPTPLEFSMAYTETVYNRSEHLWNYDSKRPPFFGYVEGVGGNSFLYMYDVTGDKRYFDYAEQWCDTLIHDDGTIERRAMEAYNLDLVRGGWVVGEVYRRLQKNPDLVGGPAIAKAKMAKYKKAMETQLIKQLKNQPRTCDGGFWHKLVYQHQMWLDGLYMASPFMAMYGEMFNQPQWQAEALQQVITCWRHTYDPKTGLPHHAWDEAAAQRWSDKEGHSPNFWGRSTGWYLMAMVDILDYIPEGFQSRLNLGHKDTIQISGRDTLIAYINKLVDALPQYQRGGLWYQVMDCPDREGNWAEGTVTAQFLYAIAKSVNKGYIPADRIQIALDAYNGMLTTQFRDVRGVDEQGHVVGDKRDPFTYEYGPEHTMLMKVSDGWSLTQCCTVGGLGGSPNYRDGSYNYYIHERVRDNDGKGSGILMMGCYELAKALGQTK